MKNLLMLVILLSTPCWAQAAHDFTATGNDFLARCGRIDLKGDDSVTLICAAYVGGVADGMELMYGVALAKPDKRIFCVPASGVTRVQILGVVIEFIKAHPATAHLQTRTLILDAMMDAFGCAKTSH
jgi:hypothetical protein